MGIVIGARQSQYPIDCAVAIFSPVTNPTWAVPEKTKNERMVIGPLVVDSFVHCRRQSVFFLTQSITLCDFCLRCHHHKLLLGF